MAAFALSVSKMVSINNRSTPPSIKPLICCVYAATTSSKVTALKPGLFTSGDKDNVLFNGPIAPATNFGIVLPVSALKRLTASFAHCADATFNSYANSCMS